MQSGIKISYYPDKKEKKRKGKDAKESGSGWKESGWTDWSGVANSRQLRFPGVSEGMRKVDIEVSEVRDVAWQNII